MSKQQTKRGKKPANKRKKDKLLCLGSCYVVVYMYERNTYGIKYFVVLYETKTMKFWCSFDHDGGKCATLMRPAANKRTRGKKHERDIILYYYIIFTDTIIL